jgi:uncharacterized phage protein (TIGR01671 family)
MSRPIKFRAWDKDNKKMQTYFEITSQGIIKKPVNLGFVNHENRELKHYELMQFTGLLDKNGVEIFEGDIIKDPQGNVGKVFYTPASYLVNWHRKDGSWETDNCIGYGEVIGNVFENPELLGTEGK